MLMTFTQIAHCPRFFFFFYFIISVLKLRLTSLTFVSTAISCFIHRSEIFMKMTSIPFIPSSTHYQVTNFRLLQTEEFADDNFKFHENERKQSKQVENAVGKGEIARYEQFLLFPQCFQKACFPGASKGVIVWEWVNSLETKWVRLFSWIFSAFKVDFGCILISD